MICAWLRATVAGATTGATARGRGNATGVCCVIGGRVAKIGAGWGPRCRNSALMKIAKNATLAIRTPTNSRGRRLIAAPSLPASPSISVICPRRLRLRTFFRLHVGGRAEFAGSLGDQFDWLNGGANTFAIDRQAHRHPRPSAQPAAYIHVAVVQPHQAFHDR